MLTTAPAAVRWFARPVPPAGFFVAASLTGLAFAEPVLMWAGVAGVAGYALSGSV